MEKLRENDFYHLSQEFKAKVLVLVNKKGFFSFEHLKEGLLTKDKLLYNSLTNSAISNKNYEYILDVWKGFKINTIKDYEALHLKIIIAIKFFLSHCVFQNIWKKSINYFEVDSDRYLSTPSIVGMQC